MSLDRALLTARGVQSRTSAGPARGFTLLELTVVVAIGLTLTLLAYTSYSRSKPRANLASAAAELQGLIHQARQTALSTGNPVSVLVYPGYSPDGRARGYLVVYQDACFDFFTGGSSCGVAYRTFDPSRPVAGRNGATTSAIVDTMSLPDGVSVGPANGMGTGAALAAPLSQIPVDVSCSFCGTTGGAVQFDPAGRASFYSLSGATLSGPLPVRGGGSLSLGFDATVTDATGQRTLVILSGSGAVQTVSAG